MSARGLPRSLSLTQVNIFKSWLNTSFKYSQVKRELIFENFCKEEEMAAYGILYCTQDSVQRSPSMLCAQRVV